MLTKAYRQLQFLFLGLLLSPAAFGQTAVRGKCISLVPPSNISGATTLVLNTAECPAVIDSRANTAKASDLTFAVYADINDRVDNLNTKIDKLSKDAIDTIKATIDGQALKADDVARVVQATHDQIVNQLQNDIKKTVQDTVNQAIKDQIAAEVAKQLKEQQKQPGQGNPSQ